MGAAYGRRGSVCNIDLGDPCEVWTRTTPVAKKMHRCRACSRMIRPGEKYYRTFMIYENEVDTSKHCAACERDMQAFAKAHEHQVPHPDSLMDVLQECIDEAMPNEVRRWKAMLARVMARAMEQRDS